MKYKTFISDEIIHGTPLYIEMELKREIIKQIQDLKYDNYENITNNMILMANIFKILEENINNDFIVLKYNPMGSWYKEDEEIEILYYRDEDIPF